MSGYAKGFGWQEGHWSWLIYSGNTLLIIIKHTVQLLIEVSLKIIIVDLDEVQPEWLLVAYNSDN